VDLVLDLLDPTIGILLLCVIQAELILLLRVSPQRGGGFRRSCLRVSLYRMSTSAYKFQFPARAGKIFQDLWLDKADDILQTLARMIEDECPAFLLWSTSQFLAFVIIYLSCGVERDMKIE